MPKFKTIYDIDMEHVIATCCGNDGKRNYYACVYDYVDFLNFSDKDRNVKALSKEVEEQLMRLGYQHAMYWTAIRDIIRTKVFTWRREEIKKINGDNYPF